MSATAAGEIAARAPFSLERALEFVCEFGPLRDDTWVAGGRLTRATIVDGQVVAYELREGGGPARPAVAYQLWSEGALAPALVGEVERRIARHLSLGDDLAPLYAAAEGDAAFAPIVERLYGYHQVAFPSAFDVGAWAILSQRNTQASARAMRRALAARYGGEITLGGRALSAFPEAAAVAAAEPGEVARVIGHSQKGPALHAVAAALSQIDEAWLRAIPYAEAERWLLGVHGIGPWGAGFILLRGLGRMERLPRGERKLLAAIGQAYGRPGPVSEREAERLSERYGDQRGYWAHYLRVAS